MRFRKTVSAYREQSFERIRRLGCWRPKADRCSGLRGRHRGQWRFVESTCFHLACG